MAWEVRWVAPHSTGAALTNALGLKLPNWCNWREETESTSPTTSRKSFHTLAIDTHQLGPQGPGGTAGCGSR